MSLDKNRIGEAINALIQQRDELALKIHLAAAEGKDEFEAAKQKLEKMSAEYEPVKDAVEESAGQVFASLKLVSEEVMASFTRIRNSLR